MRYLVLLALISLPLAAHSPDREAAWRADLEALYQRILTAHPDPFTKNPKEVFEREYAAARDAIPASTDRQMALWVARLAALANDSHTSLDLTQSGLGLRSYPLGFRWFSDGLYLTLAPEGQAWLVGRRVTAMGGKPIEEVYEALRPWISHDTETWHRYKTQAALSIHDLLAAAGIVAEGGPLALQVENTAGERQQAQIPLASAATAEGPQPARPLWPWYRRNPNQFYWFGWIEEARTLYIQYNRCRESALLSIRDFGREIVEFAKRNTPDRVVIDIRDNGGGSGLWFPMLLDILQAAYQRGEIPAPAKGAYGIISKRTFSSGSLAAADMKRAGMTLVGETLGGRVSWFGETVALILPNSRMSVAVSTKRVQAPGPEGALEPDVAVEFRAADYFADRDPYLETAIQLNVRLE